MHAGRARHCRTHYWPNRSLRSIGPTPFEAELWGRLGDEINQAVGLHVELNREGDLVQHVGGLVNPTALVPGAPGKDLFDRLPEPSAPSPTHQRQEALKRQTQANIARSYAVDATTIGRLQR